MAQTYSQVEQYNNNFRENLRQRWLTFYKKNDYQSQKTRTMRFTPNTPLEGALYTLSNMMQDLEMTMKLSVDDGVRQQRVKTGSDKIEKFFNDALKSGLLGKDTTLDTLYKRFPELYSYISKNISSKDSNDILNNSNIDPKLALQLIQSRPSVERTDINNKLLMIQDEDAVKGNKSIQGVNDALLKMNDALISKLQHSVLEFKNETGLSTLPEDLNNMYGEMMKVFEKLKVNPEADTLKTMAESIMEFEGLLMKMVNILSLQNKTGVNTPALTYVSPSFKQIEGNDTDDEDEQEDYRGLTQEEEVARRVKKLENNLSSKKRITIDVNDDENTYTALPNSVIKEGVKQISNFKDRIQELEEKNKKNKKEESELAVLKEALNKLKEEEEAQKKQGLFKAFIQPQDMDLIMLKNRLTTKFRDVSELDNAKTRTLLKNIGFKDVNNLKTSQIQNAKERIKNKSIFTANFEKDGYMAKIKDKLIALLQKVNDGSSTASSTTGEGKRKRKTSKRAKTPKAKAPKRASSLKKKKGKGKEKSVSFLPSGISNH